MACTGFIKQNIKSLALKFFLSAGTILKVNAGVSTTVYRIVIQTFHYLKQGHSRPNHPAWKSNDTHPTQILMKFGMFILCINVSSYVKFWFHALVSDLWLVKVLLNCEKSSSARLLKFRMVWIDTFLSSKINFKDIQIL